MTRMSPELWERIPPEAQAIFLEMAETIERLQRRVAEQDRRIAELEARLGRTPQNSSLPPSTQHPHAKPKPKRKPSGKKRGGQPGRQKFQRALIPVEQCQSVEVLKPRRCRRCGHSLCGDDPEPLRHQVWELPEIRPLVTEYQRHRLDCPCCRTSTTAALPAGVPVGGSGPRLVAFVALLMAYFRQSKRRTALFVETILNVPCSTGLTVKHQNLAARALMPCVEELKAALPNVTAANLDETGTKQADRKAWIWVAVAPLFTVFAVRLTRAAVVVRELLGEAFDGVVTCDRYSGYEGLRRQLCWAHLKRDFQAMIDAGGSSERIGTRLLDAAHELFRHWQRYRDGTVRRATMARNVDRLKYRVWSALEDGSRCRRTATSATCRHLFDRFDYLWTFLHHADVEPTNNAAERALRHAVIWRKLSFGTQSHSGSCFVETLLSVIETSRQQHRNVFDFVTTAVEHHFAHQPAPSLLPGP